MNPVSNFSSFGDTEAGFLDVAANALAVIILATMLILIVASPLLQKGDALPDSPLPDLAVRAEFDATITPHSVYYVITLDGITKLDLDALAEKIASNTPKISSEQGIVYSLITPRTATRDYNQYRATLSINFNVLAQAAKQIQDKTVEIIAAELAAQFKESRVLPTFWVTADATKTFAPLYWAVRNENVPFRWQWVQRGGFFVFELNPQIFNKRTRTWR